ncbi:ATP-binding cassette domain-containing protein [Vibrio cincinnatiensis]|uniref:ATP-binding cassette domain-containing protein n=1 Tax=Vibrio cincinnatiensis TaxID=675 RepID=UPI001EDE76D9|nr:ATP-binding cassette domain-containing protein [Vibrio cincinnatiensis]MCG3736494.1 ATP-binding cassette domain-containing protein [Vibrio cincinnatiensis]MCG3748647.1 ATP-binding cassette domain-containing protein [Vibrio cincinnatiensis]
MHIQKLKHHTVSVDLSIDQWTLAAGQHWGIFSTHSHAASLLVKILSGEIPPQQGEITELPEGVACVSLHEQQRLLDFELENDETDFMDQMDYGSTVEELVMNAGCECDVLDELLAKTDLLAIRRRGFRQLSTGETRRVMLARAIACKPQLLILDEPYSGLDAAHRRLLTQLLNELAQSLSLLIVTSREEELPPFITHVALFDEQKLTQTLTRDAWLTHPVMAQMKALSQEKSEAMLALLHAHQTPHQYPNPLVVMNEVSVEYVDAPIFHGVSWQIEQGQHWQIRGPNGCGKSTLLGLILGDHPQCYSNDITVLGMKRGSGESIWDVKRHIGVVSSALHLQYRVNCSALEVLVSGFYDSIGLYQQPSKKEILLAREWLSILEMSEFEKVGFRQLDYGQQRLLLIGRALIKQPALLILDEPYQGLDYLNRKLIFHALNRIASNQLSQLLYVTHYDEDSLEAIHHFVDFVGPDERGYQVQIHQASPAGACESRQ